MEYKIKQFGFDKFGKENVFEEREVSGTLSEKKNVLIKVERIGINPVDALIREGRMSDEVRPEGFVVLGSEVQGEVVALHHPIDNLNVGDKVIVKSNGGGYANHMIVSDTHIYKIPEGMDLDTAASFTSTAITAYYALYGDFVDIKSGDTVAIVGASGGVGSFVLQLLKEFDVKVVAFASEPNRDRLLSYGIDDFVNYRDFESVKKYQDKIDVVIDASLYNAGEGLSFDLVKDGGTLLAMSMVPKNTTSKNVNIRFLSRTRAMTTSLALDYLFDYYLKHGLDVAIAYRYPLNLEGVKAAHKTLRDNKQSGKIILSIQAL